MKLFVTDYDNTLFIDEINLKINKRKLKELHKLGFIIVISTGRSFESIKKQVLKYNIYYDYLHCCDGGIIYDNKDNLIKFNAMDHHIINEILNLKDKTKYEEIQLSYPLKYENIYHKSDKIAGINIVVKEEFLHNDFINEFNKLKDKYSNYGFYIYNHNEYYYFCIKKSNITKASGISFMQKLLKIKKEDIYVIGDSLNDLEMIKKFNGSSIINGCQEVIEASKKSYHQVYEYIEDIIKEIK